MPEIDAWTGVMGKNQFLIIFYNLNNKSYVNDRAITLMPQKRKGYENLGLLIEGGSN